MAHRSWIFPVGARLWPERPAQQPDERGREQERQPVHGDGEREGDPEQQAAERRPHELVKHRLRRGELAVGARQSLLGHDCRQQRER